MKKAVIFGAGNIGRGFIGQLLYESDYSTTFIDVNETIISELNSRHCYPLRILADETENDQLIENVDALDARNMELVTRAISEADILATAVGSETLPQIASVIANGLSLRFELSGLPLDILICENLKNAGSILGDLIRKNLSENAYLWAGSKIGFVETSIGRMVPLQTPEMKDGDPLRICCEAYAILPADKNAFRNGIPEICGLQPYSPFSFFVERKLYIHNMGHALTAYYGDAQGLEFIWEAIGDPEIRKSVKSAMLSCADALSEIYHSDINHPEFYHIMKKELYDHVEDLLKRFSNRKLGDTVHRVGRNLRRKLSPDDRLIGALRLCQKAGTTSMELIKGISLALQFSHSDLEMPPEKILTEICGIGSNEAVYKQIIDILQPCVGVLASTQR